MIVTNFGARLVPFVIVAVVAVTVAFPGDLEAQAKAEVRVLLTAERFQVTVGDRVPLILSITYPLGHQVILPNLPTVWGPFEVRDQLRPRFIDNQDGTETASQVIEVTLFSPGTFETPELVVTVREASGRIIILPAPPVTFTAVPVLPPGESQLRDIRPQAVILPPPIWPWIAAGGVTIAILFGALVFMLVKWKGLPTTRKRPVADTRTAYEIVQGELTRIQQLDLPGREGTQEHYVLVADSLRQYIQNSFQVPAPDLTVAEIDTALKEQTIPIENANEVINMLEESELVKFTGIIPDADTASELTIRARNIIDAMTHVAAVKG